jgi:hypothetical protein
VEHGRDADPGAEMLGIGGNPQHRLTARGKQQIADRRFVLIGDVGDRRR